MVIIYIGFVSLFVQSSSLPYFRVEVTNSGKWYLPSAVFVGCSWLISIAIVAYLSIVVKFWLEFWVWWLLSCASIFWGRLIYEVQ